MLLSTIGVAGLTMAQEVAAAGCGDPPVWFDRARWCGYFKDRLDQAGDDVRIGGIPASVNSVQELIDLVMGDLNSGNAQRRTGAKFLIYTMIDLPAGTTQNPSAGQLNTWATEWQERLRTYSNVSENGTTSRGVNGRIDWFLWQHLPCGTKNTFYQDNHDDVAPYLTTPSNSDCEVPSALDDFIVIRNTAGTPVYMIRRECMNPMGVLDGLPDVPPPNFDLQPAVGAGITDEGGALVAGTIAQVGDTVRFTFTVRNTGATPSSGGVECTIFGNMRNGYAPPPAPPTYGSSPGYIPPPVTNCPPVAGFPIGGIVTVATQDVVVTAGNQTICRTLRVSPVTPSGPARGQEACVYVANKPYLKVYGGDVSAGGGLETAPDTCVNNTEAALLSWNKRVTGMYAGAGVQYAAFALGAITDVATAQGNAAGAPAPAGLSFANTDTGIPLGNFGGTFGSAACISDYYARKPNATLPAPSAVAGMNTGVYSATGQVTLGGGALEAGERISVYVEGDVFINSNITYPVSWGYETAPLFQLVVSGNVYISSAVTQLDGLYIAQRKGNLGGTIYTCATGMSPPALANGAFFNTCSNKLTINGAFVAHSVEFLRTAGTLSESIVGENSVTSTAGEVFNFNPSIWMAQPVTNTARGDKYDAITSLPPVL
jgi:hypothetical protein